MATVIGGETQMASGNSSPSALSQMQPFKDYEIMIEYKNLPQEPNYPAGLYLIPKLNTTKEFEGVFFVPRGPYAKAILLFNLILPEQYPAEPPKLRILSRLFHPLLSTDKTLIVDSLVKGVERKGMCTMLEAMAKAFDEETMYGLEESVCADVEALRLLKTDRIAYDEELVKCIEESIDFARRSRSGMINLAAPPVSLTDLSSSPTGLLHSISHN